MKKYTPLLLVVLLSLPCGCGGRSSLAIPKMDSVPAADLSARDARRADSGDAGSTPVFCTGAQNRLLVNGQEVAPTSQVARVGVTNLCNTHTLYVWLKGMVQGTQRELQFYMCLDGVDPDASMIKLSGLASYGARAMLVPCGTANCTLHHGVDADFSGQAAFSPTGATPGMRLDLCVEALAKSSTPSLYSLQLRAWSLALDQACEQGSDPSCNHSLMTSAIRGKCEKDGTCTCKPGVKKVVASGKCL